MGKEVTTSRFSRQDFKAFDKCLREETALLEQWFADDRFSKDHPKGGFELEAWLVDSQCRPAPINDRFIERCRNPLVVPELAKFNIEMNGSPQPLTGTALHELQSELEGTWTRCSAVADQLDTRLVMIGTLPTVRDQDLTLDNMSRLERYRALNEQVLRLRRGRPLALNIQGNQHLRTAHYDVMLESAATSFQIHLQVESHLATRLYNAAQVIAAPMVAATANSPYLFGKDLWDETRIPLFEQAVAAEGYEQSPCGALGRVSFGRDYVRGSLFECFRENLECYPVLLPACTGEDPGRLAHLRLHNGTIWRWNRPLVGFDSRGRPHLRIEHRVVPAGPTIVDAFANAALFFGLVHALGTRPEPPEAQIEFVRARENFYTAARLGLRARLTWLNGETVPAPTLLLEELLPLAHRGLEWLGIDHAEREHYLGIIEQRVRLNRTGAAWQRAYVERNGADMRALTAAYLERQQRGTPVHEWSL